MTQLFSDSGNIEAAIQELERALPIEALRSIIATREAKHKPRAELRRALRRFHVKRLIAEMDRSTFIDPPFGAPL